MRAVYLVLGLLALVVVGAVSIDLVDDTINDDPWVYGEYREITGAVSASGSLEMVDGLVHAHDLGTGAIGMEDGEKIVVNVEEAEIDVFFMTGQSNSCWRVETADNSEASPVPPPGTAYVYALENGNYSFFSLSSGPVFLPMTSPSGESQTASQAPAFAASYYEKTGRISYWICGGWGGKAIAGFNPDGGEVWPYMANIVQHAIKAIDTRYFDYNTMYYMWIQGESNRSTPVETYKENFMAMHDAILDGDMGVEFSHCFIALPRTVDAINAVEAQKQLAEEHPDTITIVTDVSNTFTVANGLLDSDNLHYTQAGNNIIGAALGDACADYYTSHDTPRISESLMSVIPVIFGITVGIMAIGFALRAIMGRD